MPSRYAFNLGFDNEQGRAEFERERRRLEADATFPIDEAAERLLELAHALDAGVSRCKALLVATPLAWDDESDALGAWISRQHQSLGALGARRVESMRRENRNAELLERVAAAAFFHAGEALKWNGAGARPDYTSLHDLLLLSMPQERHRVSRACVVDGRRRETTLEALYFRALLLDRFCTGSLPRSQLELLDAWLWEWMAALRGERQAPEGAALRVDLDRHAGLREADPFEPGASLHLALAPLEKLRQHVVDGLHAGRVTPAHGCASELRIEEHVALLDHLERAFHGEGEGTAPAARAGREAHAGLRVELWVGIAEILANGMNVGVETGRWRVVNLQDPAIEEQARARFGEATKRYLWQVDTSATGCGFQALDTDASGIHLGDLVGWRRLPGGPVSVGYVARRQRDGAGQVFIGVRLLTQAAQPIRLASEIAMDKDDGRARLFVPGADNSGRDDGFLMPEGEYETRIAHVAHTPAGRFRLRFNRIRERGRGWLLAGFEVTSLSAPAATTSPNLQLEEPVQVVHEPLGEGDAWDFELSARLRG
jgi:hypothetical protein